MGAKSIGHELGIAYAIVERWVNHYKREGIEGLKEKRGKSKGVHIGRHRKNSLSDAEKIKKLEAENEYLKKLLKKGMVIKKEDIRIWVTSGKCGFRTLRTFSLKTTPF